MQEGMIATNFENVSAAIPAPQKQSFNLAMLNNAGELDFDSDDESNNGKMPQPKPLGQMQPTSSLLRRSTRIS